MKESDKIINISNIIENKIALNNDNLSGIYFLIKDNKVVYVGKTENGFSRIITHIKKGEKIFDSYAMFNMDTELLDEVEIDNILYYKPIYNKSITSHTYIGLSAINQICRKRFGSRKMRIIKKVLQILERDNKIRIKNIDTQKGKSILINKNSIDLIITEVEKYVLLNKH
jgi:hypothetical protein